MDCMEGIATTEVRELPWREGDPMDGALLSVEAFRSRAGFCVGRMDWGGLCEDMGRGIYGRVRCD